MKKETIALILIIIFALTAVGLWSHLCPILYTFPKPTGPYCVGYVHYHWSNKSLDAQRAEFNAELFYPRKCTDNASNPFPYQPQKMHALASIKAAESWLPYFAWRCMLSNIVAYAEPNALISTTEASYPVLIYLPGIAGDDLHNVYLEELASHGYIICAIEPPYDTTVTVFPNNTIIPLDPNLKKTMADNDRDGIYAYRNQAHVRWNKYIETAIEQLHLLHNDMQSMFYHKLDFDRLGLIGQSHGGAVVTDFCQKHTQCKAGVNMDGWTKTYNNSNAFNVPFLFLLSETGGITETQPLFENNNRPDFKKVTIPGAGHLAFNDYVLVKKPIAQWFGIVTSDAHAIIAQIKNELVTFFNTYLKNTPNENDASASVHTLSHR